MTVSEGELLWEPSEAACKNSNIARYLAWLEREKQKRFADYESLWRWSVDDLEGFWASIAEYFDVVFHAPYKRVLSERNMPGARWFDGARLNYAEHALRHEGDGPAVISLTENGTRGELGFSGLRGRVARARAGLARLGVGVGDRVAACVSNDADALVCFLATASLGGVWSSAAPEFGVKSVLDRFEQIEPKVFIAVDGYHYGGRVFDRREALREIAAGLPSLEKTVVLTRLGAPEPRLENSLGFDELTAEPGELGFEPVPFDHPLWVLYSSGTTGPPKAIVQGHGGILLEHYKALALHCDLGQSDRFFWFSTTGWMMWNFLVSGLLTKSTLVLYDGSPAYPGLLSLFRLAASEGVTYFGTSAPFLNACQKTGINPAASCDLTRIRSLGTTGAPLSAEGFGWVYEHVGRDLLLGSVSGGTDVCTAFALSCPLLPVHAGEIQCRGLGAKLEAFDEQGRSVTGKVGELVLTEPLPSMPLFFWGDVDGSRYRESYFDVYPGVWRHGDWVKITERDSLVIYGRSDSTLNRGGVRMGTSEFYRVVEALDEVSDSLVVDTGALGEPGKLWLFVVLAPGAALDAALGQHIKTTLRRELSPRHVPDAIIEVGAVPKTLNGKKLEVPIKRILSGVPVERAVNAGTLSNPDALESFLRFAPARV